MFPKKQFMIKVRKHLLPNNDCLTNLRKYLLPKNYCWTNARKYLLPKNSILPDEREEVPGNAADRGNVVKTRYLPNLSF